MPKIALTYDKVNTWGGAERVLLALNEIFPEAPLYTSVYREPPVSGKDNGSVSHIFRWTKRFLFERNEVESRTDCRSPLLDKLEAESAHNDMAWTRVFPKVIPSFVNRLPMAKTNNQLYTPLMPMAFESLDLSSFDIVISVTSGEAKGVITGPRTLHLCYCLTPTRYLWSDPGYESYRFGSGFIPSGRERVIPLLTKEGLGEVTAKILNSSVHTIKSPFLASLRTWDYCAAQRPDAYATISEAVKKRIGKYYRREAEVIYPFVNLDKFKLRNKRTEKLKNIISKTPHASLFDKEGGAQPYFLVVSRLAGYKRVDLAVKACDELGLNLVVVGEGPEENRLKNMRTKELKSCEIEKQRNKKTKRQKNDNTNIIMFLGRVEDEELVSLYQNCEALIMPQEEDFGLVALEAQACGRPVIALSRGGATETVVEGRTGLFFEKQTVEALVKALKQFNNLTMKQLKSSACRKQAQSFSLDKFKQNFRKWVLGEWKKYDKIIR